MSIHLWIARDSDGNTALFHKRPTKDVGMYDNDVSWEPRAGDYSGVIELCPKTGGVKRGECKRVTIVVED